jgi:hypothetical protein
MYMVNSSFNVLLLIWVAYYWVETKGRTLEEIDAIFDGEKHSETPDLATITKGKSDLFVTEEEQRSL